jgi:predicted DNA-binding transcriptional regulator AlpA
MVWLPMREVGTASREWHPPQFGIPSNMLKSSAGAMSAGSILLTVDQLAEQLNLSASHLNKLRVRGDGPAFCKIGRRVGYRLRDVESWLDRHQQLSTSETVH